MFTIEPCTMKILIEKTLKYKNDFQNVSINFQVYSEGECRC